MVRTNLNQNEPVRTDDKETTVKKRTTQRKKVVVTGVWPCKINGCNKQFAREADLKRHQRTTKLHSMPSFACPQCDATFTRTDALRRHQKSRHNGVVIEALDKDDNDDDGSSGSHSRSATPSSKGKERECETLTIAPHPAPTTQHNGPSPYYRQHTLTTTPYVPRPVVMAPHYPQVALPTSATRLNVPTHWGYPPWPDGTSTHPTSYPHMYYPSPHYRQNGSVVPPPGQDPSKSTAQRPTPASGSSQGATDTQKASATSTLNTDNSLPVDSPLDPNESVELTAEQISTLAKLLEEQRERSSAESRAGSASTTAFSETDRDTTVVGSQDDNDLEKGKAHAMHDYGPPLDRPEPMEHMLTEDGEPMLNPAELLTQESLASPPP